MYRYENRSCDNGRSERERFQQFSGADTCTAAYRTVSRLNADCRYLQARHLQIPIHNSISRQFPYKKTHGYVAQYTYFANNREFKFSVLFRIISYLITSRVFSGYFVTNLISFFTGKCRYKETGVIGLHSIS